MRQYLLTQFLMMSAIYSDAMHCLDFGEILRGIRIIFRRSFYEAMG